MILDDLEAVMLLEEVKKFNAEAQKLNKNVIWLFSIVMVLLPLVGLIAIMFSLKQ